MDALPGAARRQLAGHAVAALMTSALIAAPFLFALPAVPARSLAAAVPLPVAPVTSISLAASQSPVPAALRPVVSRPVAVRASLSEHATAREAARRKDKTLGRRLAGFLAGAGRYSARPFTTLATALSER